VIAFGLALAMTIAFAFTNGFHDAANAIATLVATRAARPLQAVVVAAVFNLLGPLLLGAAVADTVAGIVNVSGVSAVAVVGAGLTGAVAWNLFTWSRGLPSSSSHALIGGLVGAAVLDAGMGAVNWGGFNAFHPVGVIGVLVALAVSPVLGFALGWVLERAARRALRRGTVRWESPFRNGQWVTSAWLAFTHGANDSQKAIGVLTGLLVANGNLTSFVSPLWTKLAASAALTLGTALGGWRIVRTIGRRIFHLRALDGMVSQSSSAGILLAASLVGAPISTTQVVSSSVVGIGVARRRHRHVDWLIVRDIGLAWVTTLPAAAALGALALPLWKWLS
jgi:inorganic phosphate transporter, PiT family